MRTLKLVVAYVGTRYAGWQRQPSEPTIQAAIEDALQPLNAGAAVRVVGAGRTDAGVHARGQVASCRLVSALPVADLRRALNARLAADIRVLDVADVPESFHARYGARSKTYTYRILNGPTANPFAQAFVWHLGSRLDEDAMRRGLLPLLGCHDFKAFQATGTRVVATERTLFQAGITVGAWAGLVPVSPGPSASWAGSRMLTFQFVGDGFLRHMVRNIVGTLVAVGLGRRDAADPARVLAARDRQLAGATAPPQGLVLESVSYPDEPVP